MKFYPLIYIKFSWGCLEGNSVEEVSVGYLIKDCKVHSENSTDLLYREALSTVIKTVRGVSKTLQSPAAITIHHMQDSSYHLMTQRVNMRFQQTLLRLADTQEAPF